MSKWDDFKRSVGYYADKTAKKTRELTDTASLKIKIASKEADRDTEYKNLGRLTYEKLKNTKSKDTERLTLEISKSIEALDSIISEIDSMRKEEKKRKAEKEAEKAERTAKKEAEEKAEEKAEAEHKDKTDKAEPEASDKKANSHFR